jgi:hypothetical protein
MLLAFPLPLICLLHERQMLTWLPVASDPFLDDPHNNMEQHSVYAARGFLIESTQTTW